MSTFTERLDKAIKGQGLRYSDVDKGLYGSLGNISSMMRRKTNPSIDVVEKLASYLGVEFLWLAQGVGPMKPAASEGARYPLAQKAVEMFGPKDKGGDGSWTDETCRGLLRVALKEKRGDLRDVYAWRAIGDMLQRSLFEEIGEAMTEEDDEELEYERKG